MHMAMPNPRRGATVQSGTPARLAPAVHSLKPVTSH